MIIFKGYGKTVRISNRHWQSLRRRFNPDNAKEAKKDLIYLRKGDLLIKLPCSLCETFFKGDCKRCPFNEFSVRREGGSIENAGCQVFMEKLFKPPIYFWMEKEKVAWKKDFDSKARKQLKRIQKFMDEIEAQQTRRSE